MHVAADAAGTASPLPNGVRVTFGPQSQDLNPTTEAAVRAVAQGFRANGYGSINISAYAEGTPDDPSSARRLALARALTVRAVLINAGVESHRIYPRSMAAIEGDTDRNRVDILLVRGLPAGLPQTIPETR